jgi:uncharacterized coiled-coil protein SlyX
MILEIGDGRELELPDECSDEFARQLKKMILTLEQNAAQAQAEVRLLRDEMASLRETTGAVHTATVDNTAVVAGLNAMRAEMQQGFARMTAAIMAPTQFEYDEVGAEIGAKKVLR